MCNLDIIINCTCGRKQIRSNDMYKAIKNRGIYYELNLLIDYIEDDEDLELLNELLVDFRKDGLTQHDLSLAIELIEEYFWLSSDLCN